jgi:hypothetical protein
MLSALMVGFLMTFIPKALHDIAEWSYSPSVV